jgi:iron(III) transport system permease protein
LSSGSETLGVVFFSFQQGGDSTYAAALGVLTAAVSIALMLSTLLLARRLPPGVLPWRD